MSVTFYTRASRLFAVCKSEKEYTEYRWDDDHWTELPTSPVMGWMVSGDGPDPLDPASVTVPPPETLRDREAGGIELPSDSPFLVTFDEARKLVREKYGKSWTLGTFHVARKGLIDAESIAVGFGAREWLVDHDVAFMDISNTIVLVDRLVGYAELVLVSENLERLGAMTTCFASEPDPDEPPR